MLIPILTIYLFIGLEVMLFIAAITGCNTDGDFSKGMLIIAILLTVVAWPYAIFVILMEND